MLINKINLYLNIHERKTYVKDFKEAIINPFVVNKRIKAVIVSYKAVDRFSDLFENLGIDLIPSAKNILLDEPVDDHPDLQIHPLNFKTFVVDRNLYDYYKKHLEGYEVELIKSGEGVKSPYPYDCILNLGRISKYYVHNGIIDSRLNKLLEEDSLDHIFVKQGYGKCSILNIRYDTIITQDMGIHKAVSKTGLRSYLLPPGHIDLPGYNTGFIGGCGGLIDEKTMVFSGDIKSYKYCDQLTRILNKYDINIIYPNYNLRDIGSIIPIKE